MSRKSRKIKKQSGTGLVFTSLSFVVIFAALVFGMSVFFRVSTIEVLGASHYSESEIITASGLREGDSLIFIDRDSVAERISSGLLFAGNVNVSRRLPNAVLIEISESSKIAIVETDSGPWIIDRYCRLIQSANPMDTYSYIRVIGFSAIEPQAGIPITVNDEDKSKLTYLKSILPALDNRGMADNVSSIDLSNTANAQMEYLGRFTVRLGRNERIDQKLGRLSNVVAALDLHDTGTIDLSRNGLAHFRPN